MVNDFRQIEWDQAIEDDCRQIVRLAVREDLDRLFDWTTVCLVPTGTSGRAAVVARQAGIACGLRAAQLALSEMDAGVKWTSVLDDGAPATAGATLATLHGEARSLLTGERILLNLDDSSIFPVDHPNYGMRRGPRTPFRVPTARGSIVEFPMPTLSLRGARSPFGGGAYLRLLPYWYTRWGIRFLNEKEGQPACVYVHPWEI